MVATKGGDTLQKLMATLTNMLSQLRLALNEYIGCVECVEYPLCNVGSSLSMTLY